MNGNEIWIWVAVGLSPYHIKRSRAANGIHTLEVRALFWSLLVQRRKSRREWAVRIPLIERLRNSEPQEEEESPQK